MATEAFAQECEYVETDEGILEDFLVIKGVTYQIFEEKRARVMLKDLVAYESMQQEMALKQDEIERYQALEGFYLYKIEQLSSQVDFLRSYALDHGMPEHEMPFYKSPSFNLLVGVAAGVGLVYASSIVVKNIGR